MLSGPIDVEWLAFRAGIKPAIRITTDVRRARRAAARFRNLGACVVGTTGLVGANRIPSAILYVARSRREAEQLRLIERDLVAEAPECDPPRVLELNASLGARLGYPKCCIDAFCARIANPPAGISVLWLSARDAWVASPSSRLNSLLLPERIRLITFEPCRYDCAAASRIADSVFQVVRDTDAHAAEAIDRELARPMVVAPDGCRALVTLERGDKTRIAASEAPRDLEGNVVDPESARSSARFVGALVDSAGRLDAICDPPAVCIDFGRVVTTGGRGL
ncbi:MAG: hypothetical protein HY898_11500 [Deltaproteobacteria bacterium]|nr:hypothetical protein [Deltaproteobacteria bacterium]